MPPPVSHLDLRLQRLLSSLEITLQAQVDICQSSLIDLEEMRRLLSPAISSLALPVDHSQVTASSTDYR